MAIIEVALHKWRMLDDRRRRVILGAILIVIIVLVAAIIFTRSSGAQPDPNPDPEPKTTPAPQPDPTPEPFLVASADGLALLDFSALLNDKEDKDLVELSESSKLEFSREDADNRFRLELVQANTNITWIFVKDSEKDSLEAESMSVKWTNKDEEINCEVDKGDKQLFPSKASGHYKCNSARLYSCRDIPMNLTINRIEVEVNRSAAVDVSNKTFETEANECAAETVDGARS